MLDCQGSHESVYLPCSSCYSSLGLWSGFLKVCIHLPAFMWMLFLSHSLRNCPAYWTHNARTMCLHRIHIQFDWLNSWIVNTVNTPAMNVEALTQTSNKMIQHTHTKLTPAWWKRCRWGSYSSVRELWRYSVEKQSLAASSRHWLAKSYNHNFFADRTLSAKCWDYRYVPTPYYIFFGQKSPKHHAL